MLNKMYLKLELVLLTYHTLTTPYVHIHFRGKVVSLIKNSC